MRRRQRLAAGVVVACALLLVLKALSAARLAALLPSIAANPPRNRYVQALEYLHHVQHPPDCATVKLAKIHAWCGGGFGSKFQSVASRFAQALSEGYTALIYHDLGPYTLNEQCNGTGWACLFQPVSSCQTPANLERAHDWTTYVSNWTAVVPAPFQAESPMFWWASVQAYLFRPSNASETRWRQCESDMRWRDDAIHIGLHIRQGDKKTDWSGGAGSFNHDPQAYFIETQLLVSRLAAANATANVPIQVFVASDDLAVKGSAKGQWQQRLAHTDGKKIDVRVIMCETPSTMYLSQNHFGHEMVTLLEDMRHLGYGAGLDILADIYFLARSDYLIGLCMSQPMRIALALGRANGTLMRGVAMDFAAAAIVDESKLGVQEGWQRGQRPCSFQSLDSCW